MSEKHSGKGALICIPTYNEKENIEKIIPAVLQQVPEAHILVVDDNSPDGTGDIADSMSEKDERIHVLHRTAKEGLGKAYLSAFEWGLERDYQYFFEFDADFSHNPIYLPEFLNLLQDNDVVIGSRRVEGGGVENWGLLRQFISWGGSFYARTVLGVSVQDLTGGFNGFRREVLEHLDFDSIQTAGYGFQIEIKYRCVKEGFKVVESPIIFPDRVAGKSKMSNKIFIEAMLQVLKLKFGK